MNQQIVDRRRLLQFFALGSIAVPVAALAGCASDSGRPGRPPRRYGGGNHGGEKSGGGGGGGTAGGGGRN